MGLYGAIWAPLFNFRLFKQGSGVDAFVDEFCKLSYCRGTVGGVCHTEPFRWSADYLEVDGAVVDKVVDNGGYVKLCLKLVGWLRGILRMLSLNIRNSRE